MLFFGGEGLWKWNYNFERSPLFKDSAKKKKKSDQINPIFQTTMCIRCALHSVQSLNYPSQFSLQHNPRHTCMAHTLQMYLPSRQIKIHMLYLWSSLYPHHPQVLLVWGGVGYGGGVSLYRVGCVRASGVTVYLHTVKALCTASQHGMQGADVNHHYHFLLSWE